MATSPASNSTPAAQASPAPDIETLKTDVGAVAQEAQDVAGQVATEVTLVASQIADEAKAQLSEQAGKIKGMAGEQKDLFASQIGGVADAMKKVAGELESSDHSSAQYARMIADTADKVSTTIRDNDVDSLFNMAQDFGRKQPAAFIGAAALLGFAASRFLMATAHREPAKTVDRAEADLGEEGPGFASSPIPATPYESGRL